MEHKSQPPEEGLVNVVNEVSSEYDDPWEPLNVIEQYSYIDISIAVGRCAVWKEKREGEVENISKDRSIGWQEVKFPSLFPSLPFSVFLPPSLPLFLPPHLMGVLDPKSPSASSNTKMASELRDSSKMASIFFVLSPTHLLSNSPQFTTYTMYVLGKRVLRVLLRYTFRGLPTS